MDKKQKAVALKYNRGEEQVPKVVAKGRNEIAERIVKLANEHEVPLVENKDLVEVLEALDLNMEIPPNLYRAVAEVLAFVYSLSEKYGK